MSDAIDPKDRVPFDVTGNLAEFAERPLVRGPADRQQLAFEDDLRIGRDLEIDRLALDERNGRAVQPSGNRVLVTVDRRLVRGCQHFIRMHADRHRDVERLAPVQGALVVEPHVGGRNEVDAGLGRRAVHQAV